MSMVLNMAANGRWSQWCSRPRCRPRRSFLSTGRHRLDPDLVVILDELLAAVGMGQAPLVIFAVYPCLFGHFDIQSIGQESHYVNTF